MKNCFVHLRSATPYSQSKFPLVDKLEKETADAFEKRTWREKIHHDGFGQVKIPAMALKRALDRASSMLGIQIPGRGKNTYTKHFLAGCLVRDDVLITNYAGLPLLKEESKSHPNGEVAIPERIHAHADGKRGSGKRVWRIFPVFPQWIGVAEFVIFDPTITKTVFEQHVIESGRYVGIGRFRAENGGLYGRFQVEKFHWTDISAGAETQAISIDDAEEPRKARSKAAA